MREKSVGGLLGKMFVPDKKERDLFLPESMILGTAPLSCNYEEGDKPRVTEQSKEKRQHPTSGKIMMTILFKIKTIFK